MMTAVLMGGDSPVHALGGGRYFHEGPECWALRTGQMTYSCRCGDRLCGCAANPPMKPQSMSLGDAAMKGLEPCAVCYPDFRKIVAQLPCEDDFGHRPIDQYEGSESGVKSIACERCIDWNPVKVHNTETDSEEIWSMGRRIAWPCMSAVILGLVPREKESSQCTSTQTAI
jgi:hypothetical protein